MILKRFEYYTPQGKVWTDWYPYEKDHCKLEYLRKYEKYQDKGMKLLNEFKLDKDNGER